MHVLLISASLVLTLSLCATQNADISCSDPPVIPFATVSDVTDEEYTVGTTVTYQCQRGYALKGDDKTLRCVLPNNEDEAEWTKPQFSCHPQSCGDPGYVQNARRIGSLFTFPSSVRYECDDGYKLIGLPDRYCHTSGSWSGKLPRCELVICARPKDIANGQVSFISLEYGSELRYKCDKGFLLNTDETIFCTSEGQWSKTDVECIEATCDLPSKPEHGSVLLLSSEDKTRAGSIARFSCDDGRVLDGASTSKCLENGQWTFPVPKCLEPCTIPYVSEGNIGRYEKKSYYSSQKVFKQVKIGSRINEDETLYLRCSENYEVLNSDNREEMLSCKDGKWSREPHCVPAYCRERPPAVDNAGIEAVNPEHGGSVSYRCFKDFRKIRTETIVCDFGKWKGILPICKNTRCLTDDLKFPGLLKGRKSSYGDGEIFEIACESRYRVAKTGMLQCKDGIWGGPLPPCIAASCVDPPPSVDLAKAEVSSVTHGSIVKYVCEDPYVLIQTSPVQCLFGKWEGQLPRCDDGRCYLMNLEKSWFVSPGTPTVTKSGDKLKVICKEGYSPVPEPPRCVNGKWTRNFGSPCKENTCTVPTIYHGEIVDERYGEQYFSYRSFTYVRDVYDVKIWPYTIVPATTSYILNCRNGYSYQGSRSRRKRITCTKGKWFPNPHCIPDGSKYYPPISTVKWTSTTMSSKRVSLEATHRATSTAETTPMFVSPTIPTVEDITEQKPDEEAPTEVGSIVEECSCEYPIDDDNLVATVDGRRLKVHDTVQVESVVIFRCVYVGFHRFSGERRNICENCGRWYTNNFPTCSHPGKGDAVILFGNNVNISVEGNLEVMKGQNATLSCVAMESDVYPQWEIPSENGIRVKHERKERETYGDILYVSILEIENADVDNEGSYECITANNSSATIYLTVIDPNVQCPEFLEVDGISVDYEMGRRAMSKASFSCLNVGQEITGKSVLTCLRNGQWSDPPPHCENIKCKQLKETEFLRINYVNGLEIDSLATFHCFAPGKPSGVPFSKCLKNGSWSDPTPKCIPPPCSVENLYPALPPNVVPALEDMMNTTLPYNATIKLTCLKEFIVVGVPAAKCGKNGTWEVQITECVSGCPSLNKPPDSKLIINPEKELYKFAETVTFSCPPGMDLSTDFQRIMCLKTGWSETTLPTCERNEDYGDYEVETQNPPDERDFS